MAPFSIKQSQGKLELIARIFADTGVKNLMKGILHLVCKYQDQPRAMAINGKPLNIDPREWDNQYNVTINVGLGNGTGDEKVAMLQMMLGKQEQILQQQLLLLMEPHSQLLILLLLMQEDT